MLQQDIVKKCADSLRKQHYYNSDIQLKPSHAHELIAAYLGYKSKNALLADMKCPISKSSGVDFLILPPDNVKIADLFNQRREKLGVDVYNVLGIVKNVINKSNTTGEEAHEYVKQRRDALGIKDYKTFPAEVENVLRERNIYVYDLQLKDLACIRAEQRLIKHFSPYDVDIDQLNIIWEIIDYSENKIETSFVVSVDCFSDTGMKTRHFSTMRPLHNAVTIWAVS